MSRISKLEAQKWVAALNGAQATNLQTNDCIDFDAHEILSILAQPECTSLRVYFARDPMNAAAQPTVILVGADANNANITVNNTLAEYGIHRCIVL